MGFKHVSFDMQAGLISQLIEQGNLKKAYEAMDKCCPLTDKDKGKLFYLQGSAKMKESAWGEALTAFLKSERCWNDGPAQSARTMIEQILNFYNKQVFGQ